MAKKVKAGSIAVPGFPKNPLSDDQVAVDEQKEDYAHFGMKFKQQDMSANESQKSLDAMSDASFNSVGNTIPEVDVDEKKDFARESDVESKRIDHMDQEAYW